MQEEENVIRYWFYLEPDTTQEERQQLEAEINDPDNGVAIQHYGGATPIDFIAIAVEVAVGMSAVTEVSGRIAKVIHNYQEKRQQQCRSPHIRVERTRIIKDTWDFEGLSKEEISQFLATGRFDSADKEGDA